MILEPFSTFQELHLLLGITFYIYDLLDRLLDKMDSPIKAADWAAALGFRQDAYWGRFTGNQCSDLLNNVDVMRKLLKPHPEIFENEAIQDTLAALEAFKRVKDTTFGMLLDEENYQEAIVDFSYTYMVLVNKFRSQPEIKFNVTLKAHILFAHTIYFLETQNGAKREDDPHFVARGLGFWLLYIFCEVIK